MKAVVVEDSRLAREGLLRMLGAHGQINVVGDAENVEQALEIIRATQPELLFLDIHMPGESGFELLEMLEYEPKVIFTTAYADYAIKSFEYNTIDYLLKPIRKDRLYESIQKLAIDNHIDLKSDSGSQTVAEDPLDLDSRIFIKDNGKCNLVEVSSIDYIESCKNYVRIFFKGDNAFVKKSLNQVESRLPPKIFFRASRKHIVNLKAISKIDMSIGDGYDLTMKDGVIIEVSRRNATVLKELLSL